VFRNVHEVKLLQFYFKEIMFDPSLLKYIVILLDFCLVVVISLDTL
jgi:hypothetical protein